MLEGERRVSIARDWCKMYRSAPRASSIWACRVYEIDATGEEKLPGRDAGRGILMGKEVRLPSV